MSNSDAPDYTELDRLLDPKGPVILVGQQLLKPASFDDEKKEVVFPPSYANPSEKKDDPPVYNIDALDPSDPSKNVCVLDSIPSQANRMEPLFCEPPYDTLIPQYNVKFNDDLPIINITQIGHRIADAAFRGTSLRAEIVTAFKEYSKGNAKELAKIGPTSLIFGVWDSRGTGVKVPRLINSIIRAFDVQQLKRSAQYTPPIKYEQEGMVPAGLDGKPADHGLADVPSSHKIGGVQVFGNIRREFSLNLELLRGLNAPLTADRTKSIKDKYESEHQDEAEESRKKGADEGIKTAQREANLNLQRYILSLALLAFTATQKTYLRQGCQLLPKGEPIWKKFLADGKEDSWTPGNLDLLRLAHHAAREFKVAQPPNQPLVFEKKRLKDSIDADEKVKSDKKASTESEAIDELKKLVTDLIPDPADMFPSGKKDPLAKLVKEIAKVKKNKKTPDDLKKLVNELEPLAIVDAGAAARKKLMLELFLAAGGAITNEQTEQVPDESTEDTQ